MGFESLQFRASYDSGAEDQDVLADFFVPALKETVSYSRLTGFFSSTALIVASKGIAGLISNGGTMRMITSPNLSSEDWETLKRSQEPSTIEDILSSCQFDIVSCEEIEDRISRNHLEAMLWMLKTGKLEIKFAVPKNSRSALFHQKVGIMLDAEGRGLSFSGSINETAAGWMSNIEQFKVFDDQSVYFLDDLSQFERYWENNASSCNVYDLPETLRYEMISLAPEEIDLKTLTSTEEKHSDKKSFTPRGYQIDAINEWFSHDCRGILAMATGTGKTKTSLLAVKEVAKQDCSLAVLITAPSKYLTAQWLKELETLFPEAPTLLASSDNRHWKEDLSQEAYYIKRGIHDLSFIVSTNHTASSEAFVERFRKFQGRKSKIMLIADEVHSLGAPAFMQVMQEFISLRLGLSATPTRYFDEAGTNQLLEYFNDVCYEFSLERAMTDINPSTGETFLCPYDYVPFYTTLDIDELELYEKKTLELTRAHYLSESNDAHDRNRYRQMLMDRKRILNDCAGKMDVLRAFLDTYPKPEHCIIYCAHLRQLEKVAEELIRRKISFSKFTGEESSSPDPKTGKSERDLIIENFESGDVDVLLAIKCLDEGVDVVEARLALILCSSTNPREFIQRRGRLLRRSPRKKKATICDSIVRPGNSGFFALEQGFYEQELERYDEFFKYAANSTEAALKRFKSNFLEG